MIYNNGGVAALVFCSTSHHCQMLQELQLWKITLSFLLLMRALYPFHFSYDLAMPSWSSVQQLFAFWHQKSLCVSCCTCALSAHLVAWRVEGKAQGFFLEATQRTHPKNWNLCLASRVFPVQGGVVWGVSVKDGAAHHEWQWLELCCACGRHSRADGSTADLLSEEDRQHCWRYLQRKSPVLSGGGWGSLEAIVASRVDASQGQLRLCKWLCSVVIQCHFNCISNLKCQLCRGKSAQIFLEVRKFTQQLRAWSSRYRDVSFWRESQNWWQFFDYSFVADVEINCCKIGVHTHI